MTHLLIYAAQSSLAAIIYATAGLIGRTFWEERK